MFRIITTVVVAAITTELYPRIKPRAISAAKRVAGVFQRSEAEAVPAAS